MGFTLPIWVAAAAKSATEVLAGKPFVAIQNLVVPDKEDLLSVSIASASLVDQGKKAMAIAFCDSGLALDLTRNLEIWIYVEFQTNEIGLASISKDCRTSCLEIIPGYGVGKDKDFGDICISNFAYELLLLNLKHLIPKNTFLRLEIIFPQGVDLAKRTSNQAFGIVDGLALIGIQAEPQISASPLQLQNTILELKNKCIDSRFEGSICFVIGENGFDLALKRGLDPSLILKVGNWLGPLFIEAAQNGVQELLLIGYHGKLIKLAGGIFHTHNHLADARLEILISLAVRDNVPLPLIHSMSKCASIEEALLDLENNDLHIAHKLWLKIANSVEDQSKAYLSRYGSWPMLVGAALFDRQRQLRWAGYDGQKQLSSFGVPLDSNL